MNIALARGSRVSAAAALVPATLAVLLAFWSLPAGVGPDTPAPAARGPVTAASALPRAVDLSRVVLHLPEASATIALDETPAARAFAAMLPLRLALSDPMGQAKSGPLPDRIDVTGATRATDPVVGVLYYWPPTGDIAIFYEDLGQSVPGPGLVRLGVVDDGLTAISQAGNRFPVHIDAADSPAAGGPGTSSPGLRLLRGSSMTMSGAEGHRHALPPSAPRRRTPPVGDGPIVWS